MIFEIEWGFFKPGYRAYNWTQRGGLKQRGTLPKHNETRSGKTKNKRRDRQMKETRHTDALAKMGDLGPRGASSIWVLFPTLSDLWSSHHSTLKLGFSLKTLFSRFSLNLHLSILQSLIFHPSPRWLMDKQEVAGSRPMPLAHSYFFWRAECSSGKYVDDGGKTERLAQLCP